jgi:hypothetical protein
MIVRSPRCTNKEGSVLSPEDDFFEKMDTIKVSHRSPRCPLAKDPNWYWYMIALSQESFIANLQYQKFTASQFLEQQNYQSYLVLPLSETIGLYRTKSRLIGDFNQCTAQRTTG